MSSLKSQLDQLGVPLYAVVKEDVGTEVLNFQPFFNGDIFLDAKVGRLWLSEPNVNFKSQGKVMLSFYCGRSHAATGHSVPAVMPQNR